MTLTFQNNRSRSFKNVVAYLLSILPGSKQLFHSILNIVMII